MLTIKIVKITLLFCSQTCHSVLWWILSEWSTVQYSVPLIFNVVLSSSHFSFRNLIIFGEWISENFRQKEDDFELKTLRFVIMFDYSRQINSDKCGEEDWKDIGIRCLLFGQHIQISWTNVDSYLLLDGFVTRILKCFFLGFLRFHALKFPWPEIVPSSQRMNMNQVGRNKSTARNVGRVIGEVSIFVVCCLSTCEWM
jgi:hypothetical protein